ncbi:MAG: cytochrome c oxidase subunit II [Chloroflexota bacterium]|nr:cytochrome c oxidase subunit II [Candidatus Sulfotelmatobacter sp.]
MSQPIPPTATDWYSFFNVVGYTAVAALIITMGAMIYFVVKYREKKGQAPYQPERHLHRSRARDAIIFASISITLLTVMSIFSFTLTPNTRFSPPTSQTMIVHVNAFQWAFRFEYSNGLTTINQLNLPENTTVLFNVTSDDVYHNFYLNEFRTSIDAIPGRYNTIWITTPRLDGNNQLTYNVVCKELCGTGHTYMFARLNVTSKSDFDRWLSNQTSVLAGG